MDRLDAMRLFVRVAELGASPRWRGSSESPLDRDPPGRGTRGAPRGEAHGAQHPAAFAHSAGTAYLEKCRVILNLVDAPRPASRGARRRRGNIRVGLPLSFGSVALAPLLLEFASGIRRSASKWTTGPKVDLVEEGFDLSIRITSRLPRPRSFEGSDPARVVTVAHPAYFAGTAAGEPIRLAGHECLAVFGHRTAGLGRSVVAERVTESRSAQPLSASVTATCWRRRYTRTRHQRGNRIHAQAHLEDGGLEQILAGFGTRGTRRIRLLRGARHMPLSGGAR